MKSLEDNMLESLKNKYFQFIPNPLIIIEKISSILPKNTNERNSKGILKIENPGADILFSAWCPTLDKTYQIYRTEMHIYREISKEKFEKIKSQSKKGLEEQIDRECVYELEWGCDIN